MQRSKQNPYSITSAAQAGNDDDTAHKERPPRGGPSEIQSGFYQAALAFRFLRQPSRPNAPRPVAKSVSRM
jgi:hypothetical protein